MAAKKDPVLVAIGEAIVREEMAVPLYTSHISAALFWSGLPEETQAKIIDGLKLLARESLWHIRLLRKVERIYKTSASF